MNTFTSPRNVISNFWRIFFQAALAGYSLKKNINKARRFSSQAEASVWKILSWLSEIPPGRDEMKNVPSLCKSDKKFVKKRMRSFNIVYCDVPLVIPFRVLYKLPLISIFILFVFSCPIVFDKFTKKPHRVAACLCFSTLCLCQYQNITALIKRSGYIWTKSERSTAGAEWCFVWSSTSTFSYFWFWELMF